MVQSIRIGVNPAGSNDFQEAPMVLRVWHLDGAQDGPLPGGVDN